MTENRPRLRRSSTEVRALLYSAAREVFQAKGYHAASTREIAERAGVTEPMLFRHFGSKAKLFEHAVFAPFIGFIDEFVDRWSGMDYAGMAPPELARTYIDGIYQLLVNNRDLLATVLAERGSGGLWPYTEGDDLLENHLDTLTRRIESFLAAEGTQTMNVGLAVRLSMSLLMGVALLEQDLFAGIGEDQDRPQLVDQMADFLLRAIGYQSGPGA